MTRDLLNTHHEHLVLRDGVAVRLKIIIHSIARCNRLNATGKNNACTYYVVYVYSILYILYISYIF
jgi:hypothetical protein